jgi:small-conductance mechanosensitive channel
MCSTPPCRELKTRVEDLSSRLASNPTAVLEERAAAAEARCKQLSASFARKEAALREAKAALQDAQAKAEEAAAGRRGGGGNGAGDELERQLKVNGRLRAELTRKEAALQVCGSACMQAAAVRKAQKGDSLH